jgi:hypothetical protein
MKKNNAKKMYYGAGLLLAGLAAGTAAVAAVLVHKKNNEKVFREAELRAMEEMDEMKAEDEGLYGDVPMDEEDTSEIDVQPVEEDLLKDLSEEDAPKAEETQPETSEKTEETQTQEA